MKTITLLFLVFLSFQLFAQRRVEDGVLLKIRSLRFSIFDALEPHSNSFLLSYEHQISQHLSILAEAGPTIGSAWSGQVKRKRTYGPKMRYELRAYSKAKYHRRFYIGLQYMHKKLKGDDFEDSFHRARYPSDHIRYEYDYLKTLNALHLTIGKMSLIHQKILFDYGFFIGFRHKQLKAVGVPDGFVLDDFYEDVWLQPTEEIPFDNMKMNVGVLFRIGFGFNKISGSALIGPYERF